MLQKEKSKKRASREESKEPRRNMVTTKAKKVTTLLNWGTAKPLRIEWEEFLD